MRLKIFLKDTYRKLVKIDASNQKIALGLGLGVFFGVLPGVGPIISLALASALRVNKAAALLGCLLTNTWISFVTAIFAVKIGAWVFGTEWQGMGQSFNNLTRNFSFSGWFKLTGREIFLPVIAGYAIIASGAFLAAYLISLIVLNRFRQKQIKGR